MSSEHISNISEINLHKNAVFIVKNGKIDLIPAPQSGYGKQIISWSDQKPTHIDISSSMKI